MTANGATAGAAPRIGILGGTFDPIHLGHLASASHTANAFLLGRVLLVLSARPPHKDETAHASIEDRLAMLRLAATGQPLFDVSDLEARRPGASYTVDTLREVGRTHPGSELFLIVGIDAWREVDTWHHPEEILELANVIVTSRPGAEFQRTDVIPPVAARSACCYDSSISSYVHRSGHRLTAHQIAGVDVSATDVRRRIRDNLPFEHPLPSPVANYIRQHGLYA
jgi:nicotinate-nucleotide adenylyltransferase